MNKPDNIYALSVAVLSVLWIIAYAAPAAAQPQLTCSASGTLGDPDYIASLGGSATRSNRLANPGYTLGNDAGSHSAGNERSGPLDVELGENNADDNGKGAYGRAGIPRRGAGADGIVGTLDDAGPADRGPGRTDARNWGPGVNGDADRRNGDVIPLARTDTVAGKTQTMRAVDPDGPDTSNYDWVGWFGLLGLLGLFSRNRNTTK